MVKKADGEFVSGEDLGEFQEKLTKNIPKGAKKASTVATPPSIPSGKISTKSASMYGRAMASNQEKFTFTSKGAATEKGFNPAIQASIKAYRGSTYTAINKAMRFDADFDDTPVHILRHVMHLERAFKIVPPTTADIWVGRKVQRNALEAMAKNAGIEHLEDIQPGAILRDPGVVSTSHKEGVWSGSVKFEIMVPAGTKAIDLSETINSGEAELMLPPESGLKIKEVLKNHKGHDFYFICEHVS